MHFIRIRRSLHNTAPTTTPQLLTLHRLWRENFTMHFCASPKWEKRLCAGCTERGRYPYSMYPSNMQCIYNCTKLIVSLFFFLSVPLSHTSKEKQLVSQLLIWLSCWCVCCSCVSVNVFASFTTTRRNCVRLPIKGLVVVAFVAVTIRCYSKYFANAWNPVFNGFTKYAYDLKYSWQRESVAVFFPFTLFIYFSSAYYYWRSKQNGMGVANTECHSMLITLHW